MDWRGKVAFVTGAGGFIGSHLTERLIESGANVRAFVHYNALGAHGWLDSSPLATQVDVVAGDITDRDSVREAMRGADVVFHLAALIAIPYSYRAPSSYVRTNVEGTLNVLEAARETEVRRVIHTSTSEVYGTARYVPIDENHPLQGQSPYSATKIGADKIAEAFHLSFGLPVVTLRPFNTFGPRQSARAVIPTIVTQSLTGEVVRLGNLQPTRDLNYVSNTVDGYLAAAASAEAVGQTINLGSGREISIGDLADLIGSLVRRPVLGWTPKVALEEGLQRTIAWIEEHLGSYRIGTYVV